jgi:hypothetical protein
MKKLFLLSIILTLNVTFLHAQKKIFIRVYDLSGHKSAKGFLAGTTDTSVLILKDSVPVSIPVSNIGHIKTKRSIGHTILLSSIIGGVTFGIIGAASGEKDVNDGTLGGSLHDAVNFSPGEGFEAGLLLGSIITGGVGAIIHAAGRHHTFTINGNLENFKHERQAIDNLLQ